MSTAAPLSYLHTAGPAGDPVTLLGWGLGIISVVVFVIVTVLLLWAIFRRRTMRDAHALAVRSDSGGLAWIYVGVGLSTIVLIACAAWTVQTIAKTRLPAGAAPLTVQVTAWQWWWGARYPSSDPTRIVTTANEIHVPVGRPVRIELTSFDVIHSFWIPKLAGKTDVIPGQTNVMWLQADAPGVYRGQCAEFCGAQHAKMALEIHADAPDAFDAWQAQQITAAAAPAGAVAHGEQVFVSRCGACHTVRGTDAGGILGPDLTHLMSRHTLAAGTLPNDARHLQAWVAAPQTEKPGTKMPDPKLSHADLTEVVGYLATLN